MDASHHPLVAELECEVGGRDLGQVVEPACLCPRELRGGRVDGGQERVTITLTEGALAGLDEGQGGVPEGLVHPRGNRGALRDLRFWRRVPLLAAHRRHQEEAGEPGPRRAHAGEPRSSGGRAQGEPGLAP